MEKTGSEQQAGRESARRGLGWWLATWAQLVIGLALVGEGGALYAHAWAQGVGPAAWAGILAALIGAIMSLSGTYVLYRRTRPREAPLLRDIPARPEPTVPMLGALLVFKYHALSEEQLEEALAQQRREGPDRRRLGEILLDMGFVSMADLQKALEYQHSLLCGATADNGIPEG